MADSQKAGENPGESGGRPSAQRAGSARRRASTGARARREPGSRAADLEAARGAPPGRTSPADLAVSVVGQLFRLAPRLVDIQDLGARDYGLGFARGRVLWALLDSGPVLMRALSDALRISPRTVTGLIDALEADGWVTRSPHPADRRATVISLTAASERTLAALRSSYEALARDLLGGVDAADLARCRQVIATLEDRLDDAVSRRIAAYERASGTMRPTSPAEMHRADKKGTTDA
jgi:DNA-binding MarR family transcriptional regulator